MADPEKIGKYQILERIGRGGMGTIFKAHDPILNRPVALKVISTDIDVTDEVRARFFREAQACARLSHPNIVTVHDMGEDSGRMFIVMELLEGVELRRLIADRVPMDLEEKLSIMAQVCDGLAYAHQRGIIHRDIKPGNIMRLRSGRVKILDFGIAQMENVQEALTRTGLIMGTLRYMAPEQIRGRVDHRTDIFAVGAVFYEFLSLQPPFNASDVLELIEQLRTEEPAPLHVLDPTIPPELSAIVAGAMRKDVNERVADLAQMRVQIEQVQRTLGEEARRVGEHVRAQRDELRRLQATLASRIGSANESANTSTDEPRALAPLRALESDLAARIQAAQALLARADALAAALTRGNEFLEAGQFEDAVAQFERVVAEMPQHARAAGGLARARAEAEAAGRPQPAEAVPEARTTIAEVARVLSSEPADTGPETPALDRTQAAVATHEPPSRVPPPEEDDRTRVREPWGRTRVPGAQPVMQAPREGMELAEPAQGSAQAPERAAAPSGQVMGAPTSAGVASRTRWILAAVGGLAAVALVVVLSRSPHAPPGSSASPPATVAQPAAPSAKGGASMDAPAAGNTQAGEPARPAASSQPQAEQPPVASARPAEGEAPGTPPARADSTPSGRGPEQRAEPRSVEGRRDAEQAEAQVASIRRAAEQAGARFYTPTLYASAQAKERDGTAAIRRADYATAIRLLVEARSGYQSATQEAQREADAERKAAPLKASVEQARGTALAQRRQALAAGAEQLATDLLRAAEAKHTEADGLAAKQNFAEAARAYDQAAQRYGEAALRAQAPSSGR